MFQIDVSVMGKKRKALEDGEVGLPPKQLTSKVAKKSEKRLIVILEDAQLETCKVGNLAKSFLHRINNKRMF